MSVEVFAIEMSLALAHSCFRVIFNVWGSYKLYFLLRSFASGAAQYFHGITRSFCSIDYRLCTRCQLIVTCGTGSGPKSRQDTEVTNTKINN